MSDTAMHEQTVKLDSAKITLQGTLTLPSENPNDDSESCLPPMPGVVLLLPDSGPMDRNQNSIQVQLNIFNDMAGYLADRGFASLRYDKRGCGVSKGNFNTAGHSDLVIDAQAWLEYLKSESPIAGTPVYVLGHGEGSLIAAQLSYANTDIHGQILLMPFVENFENIIRRQAQNALRDIAEIEGFRGKLIRFFLRLGGDQMAKQRKLIKRIRKTRRNTLKIRKQIINAKWIREMVNIDATAIHAKVSTPTLIIGGEKDLQCQAADVQTISSLVKGPVQSHVFENLTHILRPDPEKASVQRYLMLTLEELDRRVLDTVHQWLLDQAKQASGKDLTGKRPG